MAMFSWIPQAEIRKTYTHYALIFNAVPAYFNENTNEVAVRNGWPEWLLDLFEALYVCFADEDAMIPIKILARISDGGLPARMPGPHK